MSLSNAELRFIDGALTVRVATLSPKGVPLVTPLFFGRNGDVIYRGTRRGSFQARHIAANPRVVVLFNDRRGRRTKRVLRVTGTALVGGTELVSARRKLGLALRYYFRPRAAAHWLKNWRHQAVLRRYHAERTDLATIEIRLESAEFLPQPEA